ncbi:MAG: hypothetical protein EPO40_03070 [Myxococcaceae bacterium]|nr:MAG: hypothetical protein EPO40_03070 [Myxococcaceae bacterium]
MPDQPAPVPAVDEVGVSLDEVHAEMDELGRAKWGEAQARALSRKLATQLQAAHARIAELEQQKAPGATGPGDA